MAKLANMVMKFSRRSRTPCTVGLVSGTHPRGWHTPRGWDTPCGAPSPAFSVLFFPSLFVTFLHVSRRDPGDAPQNAKGVRGEDREAKEVLVRAGNAFLV